MSITHKIFLNHEYNKFKRSKYLNFGNILGLNINPDIEHTFDYLNPEGGGLISSFDNVQYFINSKLDFIKTYIEITEQINNLNIKSITTLDIPLGVNTEWMAPENGIISGIISHTSTKYTNAYFSFFEKIEINNKIENIFLICCTNGGSFGQNQEIRSVWVQKGHKYIFSPGSYGTITFKFYSFI